MKYCASCGSEYQDGIATCVDCLEAPLLTEKEMRDKGLPLPGERDTRRFVRAGTAEDPLSAEEIGGAVEAAKIPVFVRARRAGTVDSITDGTLPWWEILVPEEHFQRAAELVAAEKQRLNATADEAARAAEEEQLETEKTGAT